MLDRSSLFLVVAIELAAAGSPQVLAGQSAPGYKIIVHPSNPVTELQLSEIKDLFLKRRNEWGRSRPVFPVDLSPKVAVRTTFSDQVIGLSPRAVTNHWIQEIFAGTNTPPLVLSSVAAVVAYVAATPGAIGYVPADTPPDGVRVVKVIP